MTIQRTAPFRILFLVACAICLLAAAGFSQPAERGERALSCDGNWGDGSRRRHCEMKEFSVAASGGVKVDGRQNGGVSVKGWDRNEVLVRARIEGYGASEEEAQGITRQIHVETAGAQVRAEGPEMNGNRGWSVSYEVFVPRQSDLSLKTHNGGISISGVRGHIEFDAVNGGVSLKELSGQVSGHTVNGGLAIALAGSRWDGEGMTVKTTNGGVSLTVPENYSARLETSTVNGGLRFDFPITMQGKIERDVAVDLGGGGATIRATTTNGGVSVKRKS